jgi:hypothetical protein
MLPTVLELKKEQVMTTPEQAERQAGAGPWTSHRLSRLLGWLAASIAKRGDMRATQVMLDGMSEAQLEDIGMRRIARRVRWLDCRESPLGIDFDYRGAALDDGGREQGSLHVEGSRRYLFAYELSGAARHGKAEFGR